MWIGYLEFRKAWGASACSVPEKRAGKQRQRERNQPNWSILKSRSLLAPGARASNLIKGSKSILWDQISSFPILLLPSFQIGGGITVLLAQSEKRR
jgi:hypothetical protein